METISKLKWNWAGHMWREKQTTIGQPALRSGRPRDTQGTKIDQQEGILYAHVSIWAVEGPQKHFL